MSGSAPAAATRSGGPDAMREGGLPPPERPPFLLDFYPLEEASQTRLSAFYDGLHEGRLRTTRCPKDRTVTWPPRAVCPTCHTEALEWFDLPNTGRIYAFSAVLAGAPLGMETELPIAVGLVDLDGIELRLFGRIVGRLWSELQIGDAVRFEAFDLPDGRAFYRFRAH